MPEGIGYSSLTDKKVNFPILGSISIATAGIVILVGWVFFTKSGVFRKPRREARIKEY
jgi:hypothetical protein